NGASTSCCNSNCTFRGAGNVCRPVAAGGCDQQETCTGSAATCPTDLFLSTATVCRSSAGACDLAENCPGNAAACPADGKVSSGTVCRSAAGVCDVAEACNGAANTCPTDTFAST